VVTFSRQPFLTSEISRALLRSAWLDVSTRFPFTTIAVCLLPDHLHCIWSLPQGDSNFSIRWKEIKRLYTKAYLAVDNSSRLRQGSNYKEGVAAVWQPRYWEHAIRDQNDLNRHLDYLHYNPVKHGLVERVADWPWSSFHRYVREGLYEAYWAELEDKTNEAKNYGE
jgi:putative transposase